MLIEHWRKPCNQQPWRSMIVARLQCDICHVIFERDGCPCDLNEGRRHFCSQKCMGIFFASNHEMHEKNTISNQRTWSDTKKLEQHSKRMKQVYKDHPNLIENRRENAIKQWKDPEHRKSLSGENHWAIGTINPWWKPWLSEDRDHCVWSKTIKQAFGNKCAICGSRNKLRAHHIVPRAINIDLQYDFQNGVLLCHGCHQGNFDSVHKLLRADPEEYKTLMIKLCEKRRLV